MGRWFFLYYTQPSGVLQFQQPFSWAEGFFHRPGYPYIAPQKVYYQYPLKRKKGYSQSLPQHQKLWYPIYKLLSGLSTRHSRQGKFPGKLESNSQNLEK